MRRFHTSAVVAAAVPAARVIARTLLAVVAAGVVTAGSAGCNKDPLGGIPGNLAGNICDSVSGRPLVNVAVHMEGGADVSASSITDAEGRYFFEHVVAGDYKVSASDGAVTRTIDAKVLDDDTSFVNEDTACREQPPGPDAGRLEGQVCNKHTGDVVTDALVQMQLPDGTTIDTNTDADGSFAMRDVPVGPHVVRIFARDGSYDRSFGVDIVAGQTFTLDLADDCNSVDLSEGGVAGTFCDPDVAVPSDELHNGHLHGARIEVKPTNGGGEMVSDITDLNGTFEVNGLAPGDYDIDGFRVVAGAEVHFLHASPVHIVAAQVVSVADPSSCAVTGEGEGEVGEGEGEGEVGEGEGEAPPVCATFTNHPEQVTDGRILLVVDRSRSMVEPYVGSTTKWQALKQALNGVTHALESQVEFGLMTFPGTQADADNATTTQLCSQGTNRLPLAPSNASAIENGLDNIDPIGGTPTATTLLLAKQSAQQTLGADGANHRPLAVLLATDGAPNCNGSLNPDFCTCTSSLDGPDCADVNCLDDLNTLTQIGALQGLGVKTFVVGVRGSAAFDGTFDSTLTSMAHAGGTGNYYAANNQSQLEGALAAITQQVLSCHIEDSSVTGSLSAADSITVKVGTQTITRDTSRHNGWDITGSNSIDLFGTACTLASTPTAGAVTVETCE